MQTSANNPYVITPSFTPNETSFVNITSVKELRRYLRKTGTTAFIVTSFHDDDTTSMIEVSKQVVLHHIEDWSDGTITEGNTRVLINNCGQILIG